MDDELKPKRLKARPYTFTCTECHQERTYVLAPARRPVVCNECKENHDRRLATRRVQEHRKNKPSKIDIK
jgi:RNA polymerase-binding transcription factor DksA